MARSILRNLALGFDMTLLRRCFCGEDAYIGSVHVPNLCNEFD